MKYWHWLLLETYRVSSTALSVKSEMVGCIFRDANILSLQNGVTYSAGVYAPSDSVRS